MWLRTYAPSPVVDAHGCTFDGNRHCITRTASAPWHAPSTARPCVILNFSYHVLHIVNYSNTILWICENVLYASSQPNKFFLQHTELLQSICRLNYYKIYSWVATWQKNEENKMPSCIHMSQQIRLQGNLMEQCQLMHLYRQLYTFIQTPCAVVFHNIAVKSRYSTDGGEQWIITLNCDARDQAWSLEPKLPKLSPHTRDAMNKKNATIKFNNTPLIFPTSNKNPC
jgi:hypothetical protein